MNDAHELPLLLEREIAVLENFTLTEWNTHKRRVLLRIEEVVRYVLKLQVCRRARSDQLIYRLALREKNLRGEVNIAGTRRPHELILQSLST